MCLRRNSKRDYSLFGTAFAVLAGLQKRESAVYVETERDGFPNKIGSDKCLVFIIKFSIQQE